MDDAGERDQLLEGAALMDEKRRSGGAVWRAATGRLTGLGAGRGRRSAPHVVGTCTEGKM